MAGGASNYSQAEVLRVALASPALVADAGSKEKLTQIIEKSFERDQTFTDRGGKFFEGGQSGKELADNFVKTHLDDYADGKGPSALALAHNNMERVGVEAGSRGHDLVVKSAVSAEIDRTRVAANGYHDIDHFVQVPDNSRVLIEKTEALAQSGDKRVFQMSSEEKAVTLAEGYMHDKGHEGKGNAPDGNKFANEEGSFKHFKDLMEEGDFAPETIEHSHGTFLATSPNGGTQIIDDIVKQHNAGVTIDKDALRAQYPDTPDALINLADNPKAAQGTLHVVVADTAGSAGSGVEANKIMSAKLQREVGPDGPDFTTKGSRMFFTREIAPESPLPAAEVFNDNRAKMVNDTLADINAEKVITPDTSRTMPNTLKANLEASDKMIKGMSEAGAQNKAPDSTASKPDIDPSGGSSGGLGNKLASNTGKAGIALDIAEGNVAGAVIGASMEAVESEKVQRVAVEGGAKVAAKVAASVVTESPSMLAKIGAVALGGVKAVGIFAKKVPVVGAVVTAGIGLVAVGKELYDGNYGKAASELAAGAAETAGNIVGLGVGDAARQAVVEGIDVAAGEEYRPDDSDLVALGKQAVRVAESAMDDDEPAVSAPKSEAPKAETAELASSSIGELPESMAKNQGKLSSSFAKAQEVPNDTAPSQTQDQTLIADNSHVPVSNGMS